MSWSFTLKDWKFKLPYYWHETSTGSSYFEFQAQTLLTRAAVIEGKHPSLKEIQDKKNPVTINFVRENMGRWKASEEVYTNG